MSDPVIDKTMATRIATQLGWEPKREWQGLTDEECLQNPYCAGESDVEVIQLARAIEAKLKEKNT